MDVKSIVKELKVLDYVIIPLFFILSVYLFVDGVLFKEAGSSVIIHAPHHHYQYDLSVDRVIEIPGILGESIIEIKDGEVFFITSPCPNKYCIKMGPISKNMATNACIPNGIILQIVGEKKGGIDSISR